MIHYFDASTIRRIRLLDTAGIHNLHAIPGVLGGIAAGLVAWGQSDELLRHGNAQIAYQLLSIIITVAISVAGGLAGGWAVTAFNPQPIGPDALFDDQHVWVHVEPHKSDDEGPSCGDRSTDARVDINLQEAIPLMPGSNTALSDGTAAGA